MKESYIDRWVGADNPVKIHSWRLLHDVTTGRHTLVCYLLVYVVSGHSVHICNSTTNILKAGSMYIIHPGQGHIYAKPSNLRIYNCLFEEYVIQPGARDEIYSLPKVSDILSCTNNTLQVVNIPLSEQIEVMHLLNLIYEKKEKQKNLYKLFKIYSHYAEHDSMEEGGVNVSYSYMITVLDYLNENWAKKVSIVGMAENIGLNSDYLNRIFKKETGLTISEYWITLRMAHAVEYLSETALPIETIAGRVGYNDFSLFSAHFKKICRMTPREYRMYSKIINLI